MVRASDPSSPAPSIFSRKVRVLLLAANPTDTARIAVGEEYRKIEASLRASDGHDRFELAYTHEVRADELAQALQRHRPDVVHFSGHGSATGELLLPNAAGQSTPTRPEDIAELFGILARDISIRCVVLNACYSEALAEALAKHVDCVIGMSTALKDKAAITFAGAFYESLGFARDVDSAYKLACNRVALTLPSRGTLPKLHHRPEVDPCTVRLLPPPRRAAPVSAPASAPPREPTETPAPAVVEAARSRPPEAPPSAPSASGVPSPTPAKRIGVGFVGVVAGAALVTVLAVVALGRVLNPRPTTVAAAPAPAAPRVVEPPRVTVDASVTTVDVSPASPAVPVVAHHRGRHHGTAQSAPSPPTTAGAVTPASAPAPVVVAPPPAPPPPRPCALGDPSCEEVRR